VTVGIFRGGERFNIIPADVHLEGTVRTYSDAARALVERRMRQILDGLTAAAGATYDLEYVGNAPATVNDPALSQRVRPWLEAAVGADRVLDGERLLVGEDFAYFAREVPGFYLRLGVEAEGHPSGGLHTPTFRADDGAVPVGMNAMAHLVWNYLASGADGEGSAGSPR
jgi:amidohydrolase